MKDRRIAVRPGRIAIFFLAAVLLPAVFFLSGACAGGAEPGQPDVSGTIPDAGEETGSTIHISISVDCASVLENPKSKQQARDMVALLIDRGLCDEQGFFFDKEMVLAGQGSAFDALRETELKLTYDSSSFGPFVRAVNGLGAGDGGSTSGWVYLVNGEAPAVSSGLFILSDGDVVQWRYSVEESDLMRDLP